MMCVKNLYKCTAKYDLKLNLIENQQITFYEIFNHLLFIKLMNVK